ncbi:MAG: AbrB/MazE/SpoVT family DNA-binding domain-containing protein [Chitinophagia bacterium]|jgi:antitoxin MazE
MKAKIIKIGNSKGIRLPNELIKEYKLDEEVTLELREDCIVIKPVEVDPRAGWEAIYQKMDHTLTQEDKDWMAFENEFDEEDWTW